MSMSYYKITKLKAKTIMAAVLLTMSQLTYANPAEQLNALLKSLNSLDGRFQQMLIDSKGEVLQESKGVFSLQRPGLFRWQTLAPFPQLLVSNRRTIWLYDEDLEQVIIRPYTEEMDKTPALLLSGDLDRLSSHYRITHQSEDSIAEFEELNEKIASEQIESDNTFILSSKSEGETFTQIALTFKNRQLLMMKLTDTLGQVSLIQFNDLKVNPVLETKLFIFEPPPGIDVIVDD